MAHTASSQAPPVEAKSLSSITTLAANPPAYPRNPAHEPLDHLVLYIVKVPGSQDVVLTPLKPPTKSSISAEEINASLYFLHVSSPGDEALLREIEQEQRQQQPSQGEQSPPQRPGGGFIRQTSIRRKPVGGNLASSDPPAPPPHQRQSADVHLTPVAPKLKIPVPPRQPIASVDDRDREPLARFAVQGGPLSEGGPLTKKENTRYGRQSFNPSHTQDDPRPNDAYNGVDFQKRWSARLDLQDSGISPDPTNLSGGGPGGRFSLDARRLQLTPNLQNERPSNWSREPASRPPVKTPPLSALAGHESSSKSGFKITLIRRDPSHGNQWNVGTISGPNDDSGLIGIEISTPGYSKFMGSNITNVLANSKLNPRPTGEDRRPSSASGLPFSSLAAWAENNTARTEETKPRVFYRRLHVTAPSGSGHRRDKPKNFGDPTYSPELGSPSSAKGLSSKLKSGYYTFTSPWNGICTFVTSVNGRSLKCKHMIPGPSWSNPAVDWHENPAVTVAEIRFNFAFPLGNLGSPSSHHQQQRPLSQVPFKDGLKQASSLTPAFHSDTLHSLSSDFFHSHSKPRSRSGHSVFPFPSHTHSDSSPDPDENMMPQEIGQDRLDLSLARERAGGGLRGTSAKLGKLIIEDEGIRMLDLVVAACMGVWWRAFYSDKVR